MNSHRRMPIDGEGTAYVVSSYELIVTGASDRSIEYMRSPLSWFDPNVEEQSNGEDHVFLTTYGCPEVVLSLREVRQFLLENITILRLVPRVTGMANLVVVANVTEVDPLGMPVESMTVVLHPYRNKMFEEVYDYVTLL